MAVLYELLDHVAAQGGSLVSNAQLLELTARVMEGGYMGSLSIRTEGGQLCAPSTASVTIDWTATLYCPLYYFRIYGRYSDQSEWTLHDETSFFVRSGSYSFDASAMIPPPSKAAGLTYDLMVVGQSCKAGTCSWPTPDSYERRASTTVALVDTRLDIFSMWGFKTTREVQLMADTFGGEAGKKVKWTITPVGSRTSTSKGEPIPVLKGSGFEFKFTPEGDTHGERRVTAVLIAGQGANACVAEVSKKYKIYFIRDGNDDGDAEPNWYQYWKSDGAVPELKAADVIYNPALGSYGQYFRMAKQVVLGTLAGTAQDAIPITAKPGCSATVIPAAEGIDCAAATVAHERKHQEISDKWAPGGAWVGQLDSDDDTPGNKFDFPADNLPDTYEIGATGTLTNVVDSCDLRSEITNVYWAYGDEELQARLAENGRKGVVANDWASPGKQEGVAFAGASSGLQAAFPVGARSGPAVAGSYIPTDTVHDYLNLAALTGSYADAGIDSDGDSTYNSLRLTAGVVVTQADLYAVVAWLETASGDAIAWANSYGPLLTGTHAINLDFDGRLIHASGADGPYRIGRVELRVGSDALLVGAANSPYNTTSYTSADFDPYGITIEGPFSDAGSDTGGDGKHDSLDISVGLSVHEAGTYTLTGSLYGSGGYAGSASAGAPLAAGSHTVTLSFNGREIRQRRADGPYRLRDLSVRNAADQRVAFAPAPYTTTAYLYSDFQPTGADLTGLLDAGIDTNGNGKYDYLRLSAGLDVITPGAYTLVGFLSDRENSEITWASRTFTVPAGVQTATLDLDGLTIGAHGVDGPYTVTSLLLIDADGETAAFAPFPFATAPYLAANFEASGDISGTVRDQAGQPVSGTVVHRRRGRERGWQPPMPTAGYSIERTAGRLLLLSMRFRLPPPS